MDAKLEELRHQLESQLKPSRVRVEVVEEFTRVHAEALALALLLVKRLAAEADRGVEHARRPEGGPVVDD